MNKFLAPLESTVEGMCWVIYFARLKFHALLIAVLTSTICSLFVAAHVFLYLVSFADTKCFFELPYLAKKTQEKPDKLLYKCSVET